MIKLIGCVLIISACTQMGCAMATDKIRQMKYLKLLRRLIFETRAMVEGGMTFGEIILKLSLQKDYSDFTFLSQDTSSPDVRRRITEEIHKSKLKIAAIGIIVAVLNLLLKRAERDEQAMMTTLAGLIVVLLMIVRQIGNLFETIKEVFGLY